MADNIEVLPWLKTLPVAPEFHPTLAEFQDPIAYIFKIEPKASKFGICKIVPPVSNSPKKAVIYNFNRSLAARNPNSPPTFTTRQQQIGFCPRKHRPVRRSVWQSGENYTLPQFEAKAKAFEKGFVKRGSKKALTALEVETLYWKASVDTPRTVEYANDMPGSAFGLVKSGGREMGEEKLVGDTAWNMRGVSRAKGSLLRFMKEEIPGVTSPMVYVAMMFSWFAWHVEDHDLHSLNYLHMGAGKTWYGVPREAAVAFEEVIRVQGYGGEINPLVTFATLCEKTTVMSPEVLTNSGVPCCRLVQNAGEFVVTFPRAYHSGFSHGFNVGEAANIATPEWLRVAKEAAIRRASINCPPMVSHFQLLYDLALSLCSRVPKSIPNEPRSSRLRDKKKGEGEALIKESFVKDVMSNNDLLHILGDESSVVLLPQSSLDDSTYSKSRVSSRLRGRLSVGLCSPVESSKSLAYGSFMLDKKKGLKTFVGPNPTKGKFFSKYDGNKISLMTDTENGCSLASEACKSELETGKTAQGDKSPDQGLFSCVTCGILNFACVAIVQPTEATANHLMSATDGSFLDSQDVGPGNVLTLSEPNPRDGTRRQRACDGLFDIPAQSDDLIQPVYRKNIVVSDSGIEKGPSSLGLLALAYGNLSDSDEEENKADHPVYDSESRLSIEANSYHNIPVQALDSNLDSKTHVFNCRSTHQSFDCSTDLETDDIAFTESHMLAAFEKSTMPYVLRSDEDSSRFHVFCLPHAAEVVQQLRPIGGAHVLLLCHPDYPELEAEAKSVAEEMGMNYVWNDIGFREATEEDENQIRSALQSEEGLHGNADWTVKLGINLFYTVNLSRSPLYSKQMAYNSIIYKAFGRSSQDYNATQPKPQRKGPLRRKKIVMAGKWCGKVWMSNQVHPLLAEKETEEEEEEEEEGEEEEEVRAWEKPEVKRGREVHAHKKPEVKQERVLESPKPAQSTSTIRKSERKRKSTFKVGKIEEAKSPKMVDSVNASDDSGDEIIPQPRRNMRSKKPKRETRNPVKTLDRNKRKLVIDDNMEAGPSARLRRRIVMPRKDLEAAKPVEAKPILKKHRPNKTRKKPLPAIATPASLKVKDEDEDGDGDEEGEYTCDIEGCSMSFGSKQELDVHKLNVCPVKGCGKTFFSHKYLLQHRRVHEDDRPLKCPWKGCNMAFKWAWARTEHIRVHTGARPYVCAEEGCGQTFRFVSDFSRHKRKTGHSKKNKGG